MRPRDLLLVAASLAPTFVLADVEFTSPAAGANVPPGTIQIAWKDSGESPPLADLTTYQIQLMVGGNTDADSTALTVLVASGSHASGTTATAAVAATLAGVLKNGFYLKMTSTVSDGGTVINYSSRFSMPGMTGTNTAAAIAGMADVSGTDGPPTVNNDVANDADAAAPAAAAAGGEYTVPYHLQTGLTKYAPMQKIPPTKITMKNYTPMNPTSSYNIAKTWVPKPTVQTTLTASQTFSVKQIENTVAAQAHPTDDMAKFLARWKD